jgi:hypothetical protein
MSYEAVSVGLRVNTTNVEWKLDELGRVEKSLTGLWWLLEYIPLKFLAYRDADTTTIGYEYS